MNVSGLTAASSEENQMKIWTNLVPFMSNFAAFAAVTNDTVQVLKHCNVDST